MKISLIYPIFEEAKVLQASLQDIQSFFSPLPLQVEIILVMDPSKDQSLPLAKKFQADLKTPPEKFALILLENQKHLGRARSLGRGLQQASGDLLFCGAIDLNIPLAEYLNTLQDFMLEPKTQILLGDRTNLKKPRHGKKNKVATLFETIEHEKLIRGGLQVNDPTCQFLVMRKHTYLQIKEQLSFRANWYYAGQIIASAHNAGIAISQKPIICHDSAKSHFRWWMGLF